MTILKEDRLLGTDPVLRALAQELYEGVRDLPIISPHGHTDPRWFAENAAFADPAQLFVTPDHYVFRMLHSQGIPTRGKGQSSKPALSSQSIAPQYLEPALKPEHSGNWKEAAEFEKLRGLSTAESTPVSWKGSRPQAKD